MSELKTGQEYKRPELADKWGYDGWQAIARGIVTPSDSNLIILFVTKEKQDSLTQYQDHFESNVLHMEGEKGHTNDQRLIDAEDSGDEIHLFYREIHHSPFIYYGEVFLQDFELYEDKPSEFEFTVNRREVQAKSSVRTEEQTHGEVDDKFVPEEEGKQTIREHVEYERSAKNRARAIEIHGTRCEICGFDFNDFYGSHIAQDYIEIHHMDRLSETTGEVDPETDLIPVCSNCHSILHRSYKDPFSVEDLRNALDENNE